MGKSPASSVLRGVSTVLTAGRGAETNRAVEGASIEFSLSGWEAAAAGEFGAGKRGDASIPALSSSAALRRSGAVFIEPRAVLCWPVEGRLA